MLTFTSFQLNAWIAAFIWPLTRILGLITVAPVFGNSSVPISVKVGLGVMLALIISPIIPAVAHADPASLTGIMILTQQFIIGLAMGFSMRIVFAAVEMAGELSGLTMGLGFATLFDPQSQGRSSAVSQFLALIAIMLFLVTNMHLVLLAALAESFSFMPMSASLNGAGFKQIVDWGGQIFSAGLQISLPIVAALLVTNIALGILTRAAPQLNLFGIGFPITLTVGFTMVGLVLPYLAAPLQHLFMNAMEIVKTGAFAATTPH